MNCSNSDRSNVQIYLLNLISCKRDEQHVSICADFAANIFRTKEIFFTFSKESPPFLLWYLHMLPGTALSMMVKFLPKVFIYFLQL